MPKSAAPAKSPRLGKSGTLVEALNRLSGLNSNLPTGWPAFDSTGLGFFPSELSLVAGRTGHAKTSFLLNLSLHWLETQAPRPVWIFSMEMSPAQVAARLLCLMLARAGLPAMPYRGLLAGLEQGKLPGGPEARGLEEQMKRLRFLEGRLRLSYHPDFGAAQLANAVGKFKGPSPAAVLVDSMHLLGAVPRPGRRDLEMSAIARGLKALAVDMNCPVIATLPMRRLEEGGDNGRLRGLLAQGMEYESAEVEDAIRLRRPRLGHLCEGGLELEADQVLGLLSYLADFKEEQEPDHRLVFPRKHLGILDVSALKNRYGRLEYVELSLDDRTGLVRDPDAKAA